MCLCVGGDEEELIMDININFFGKKRRKRMKNFRVIICIVVLILVGSTRIVWANEITYVEMEKSVLDRTQELLMFIEPEKDLYGMEDVDFSMLSLGR